VCGAHRAAFQLAGAVRLVGAHSAQRDLADAADGRERAGICQPFRRYRVPEDLFEEHPAGRVADGGIARRGNRFGSDRLPEPGVPTDNG
jgi:hypothetical protein